MSLIIASVFYNMPNDTSSFFQRAAILFFAVLLNAFGSALEVWSIKTLSYHPPVALTHH